MLWEEQLLCEFIRKNVVLRCELTMTRSSKDKTGSLAKRLPDKYSHSVSVVLMLQVAVYVLARQDRKKAGRQAKSLPYKDECDHSLNSRDHDRGCGTD